MGIISTLIGLEMNDETMHHPQKKIKSSKQRITIQISEEVLEWLKNAVYSKAYFSVTS